MYSINKNEVLRYLGYKGQVLSDDISSAIDEMSELALSVCSPLYTHILSEITETPQGLQLSGTNIILTGNDIKKHLTGAKKCITLACTLGAGFETTLLRLQAKSITKSIIFDAVGTAFIEEFADNVEEKLLLPFISEGYFSKFRYSPGYGDLPLELEKDIVNTLQCQKKIGLTFTDTNILIPRKSITSFTGIFDIPQKKADSKCELCNNKDNCKMRKDGNICD